MYSLEKTKQYRIRKILEEHHKNIVEQFHKKHGETLERAKHHSLMLAGAALITASSLTATHAYAADYTKQVHQQEMKNLQAFMDQLNSILADKKTLNREEEKVMADALSKRFGLSLKATLDGNRLNEIYGYVGQEQHLRRWAGDTLAKHATQAHGVAPLQGAFKDFDNAEQEKYYVAVQLHELPNWDSQWSTLKPWYRYRKVFIFNPANQKGVVAVIGDSGPGKFTGKTFGGSPEVMDYLQMKDGSQKGKAIILFVDDPENKIALGPVKL
jgi:hypothetical protein